MLDEGQFAVGQTLVQLIFQSMKIITALVLLFSALTVFAQTPAKSVTWKIDNLKKIGGQQVEILGNPQVIKSERGKAVLFDGVDDGIFINVNPLAGFREFTVEAVFRPD